MRKNIFLLIVIISVLFAGFTEKVKAEEVSTVNNDTVSVDNTQIDLSGNNSTAEDTQAVQINNSASLEPDKGKSKVSPDQGSDPSVIAAQQEDNQAVGTFKKNNNLKEVKNSEKNGTGVIDKNIKTENDKSINTGQSSDASPVQSPDENVYTNTDSNPVNPDQAANNSNSILPDAADKKIKEDNSANVTITKDKVQSNSENLNKSGESNPAPPVSQTNINTDSNIVDNAAKNIGRMDIATGDNIIETVISNMPHQDPVVYQPDYNLQPIRSLNTSGTQQPPSSNTTNAGNTQQPATTPETSMNILSGIVIPVQDFFLQNIKVISEGMSGNIFSVTGNHWMFFAALGNIIMLFLGAYLRLRSGRSPDLVFTS